MASLEKAAEEFQKARTWAETCRTNAKRLKDELRAAEDRVDDANNKVHLTHEALLDAALAVEVK